MNGDMNQQQLGISGRIAQRFLTTEITPLLALLVSGAKSVAIVLALSFTLDAL